MLYLKLMKYSLFLFILLSGVTITYGEPGKGILGRVAIPDVFGGIFIILSVVYMFLRHKVSLYVPVTLRFALFVVFTLILGLIVSKNTVSTLIEVIILSYEVILVIFALNFIMRLRISINNILVLIATCLLFVSVYGVYDMIAQILGLPVFIKREIFAGCSISTFRNCGQAGAYSLVFLFLLLASISSDIKLLLHRREYTYIYISIVFGILFLLLTVKVASYIGFIAGLVFLSLYKRVNLSYLINVLLIIILAFLFFNLLKQTKSYEVWHNWFLYKMESRLKELDSQERGGGKNDFLKENWELAMIAFLKNPLLGTGIGGFAGVYMKYEIHSTPLKFLGETGLLGLLAYLIFMFSLFKTRLLVAFRFRKTNIYYDYLATFFPLFLGLMVNWIYTYHFRKREFWILVFILEVVHLYARLHERRRCYGKNA